MWYAIQLIVSYYEEIEKDIGMFCPVSALPPPHLTTLQRVLHHCLNMCTYAIWILFIYLFVSIYLYRIPT